MSLLRACIRVIARPNLFASVPRRFLSRSVKVVKRYPPKRLIFAASFASALSLSAAAAAAPCEIKPPIKQISTTTKVPRDYKYQIVFPKKSSFFSDLASYYEYDSFIDIHSCGDLYLYPRPGELLISETKCFVTKDGDTFTLNFESEADWLKLNHKINSFKKIIPTQALYKFDKEYKRWYAEERYKFKPIEELIGCEKYFETIIKDVQIARDQWKILQTIGETKSLNYLLYGPPGTGKTTMIRAFASKYNYPIYIVNPGNINLDYLDKILSPKSSNETIILVFEDFDRFLENRKAAPVMSQILNSLDGLQDSSNVIRFFTGNDCDVIFNNKALINRMSAKFKFDYPTRDMFKVKLLRLLQHTVNKDQAKIDEYVDMIAEKNISMRPFISYSIRYLFDENPLEKMIANIDELNTS